MAVEVELLWLVVKAEAEAAIRATVARESFMVILELTNLYLLHYGQECGSRKEETLDN